MSGSSGSKQTLAYCSSGRAASCREQCLLMLEDVAKNFRGMNPVTLREKRHWSMFIWQQKRHWALAQGLRVPFAFGVIMWLSFFGISRQMPWKQRSSNQSVFSWQGWSMTSTLGQEEPALASSPCSVLLWRAALAGCFAEVHNAQDCFSLEA